MKRFLLIFLCFAAPAFAALPAGAIINIQSTATAGNLNGGGFNSARGGTNYSLQNAAQYTATDGTSSASTTFTSATAGFTSAMVGNYLHVTAGTGATVGWYEIVTFNSTSSVELDRASGTMTNATFYVGGAMSLGTTGTSGDDDLFEAAVAGNIFYIKSGNYTFGETVNVSVGGSATVPVHFRGYTTSHGDACTGTNRPFIDAGANASSFATNWFVSNLRYTSTGSTGLQFNGSAVCSNVQSINKSTTAGRAAFTGALETLIIYCEGVSYRGPAFSATQIPFLYYNWFHDSDIGITTATTSPGSSIQGNLITSCQTAAIRYTGAAAGMSMISGNTLFGSTNTTGIGIDITTGGTDFRVYNNIIAGFATGVSHADNNTTGYDAFNVYYNNDANVNDAAKWQVGSTSSTGVNPSFTNVGQVTGATATTTAGNHLVQSGATFQTSGVTAGRDYVYIVSGTGVTTGIYGILTVDSETQITTDITLTADATADKVFQITIGQNFGVGTAVKALAGPGAFQGGYSTSYLDPGAIQRQESGGQTSSASVR